MKDMRKAKRMKKSSRMMIEMQCKITFLRRETTLGKLESTIKSEIQRLAKREIRSTFIPLRKEVRTMRLKLSGLSKILLP